jgi:pyrimidine-specific ribonucleoside hydrolase
LIPLKHVIIDTDPGIDDALAILLAFSSPELRVEALTTVVGNVSLSKANVNALKLLEFLRRDDVPVASGADRALLRDARDASEFHGKSGLGEAMLPEPKAGISSKSAVSIILEKVEELGEELTLIAIGPLTNIAAAILVESSLVRRVGGLVMMGGAFAMTPYGHGNANAVAEFNIWHDPEAAKIVFDSGIPIRAIGLDVTTDPKNRLTKEVYDEIEGLDTRRSCLVADLSRGLVRRFNGLNLHDPLAVATVIDPSISETLKCKVEVETKGEHTRGMTVVDRRSYRRVTGPEANVDVCVSVDSERFHGMFMDRVVLGGA